MTYAQSKDGISRLLIFQESVLLIDKDDALIFSIENEHLQYNIRFTFSNSGEKYTTSYWNNEDEGYLHYQLNNWDSGTWVEISKPFPITVKGKGDKIWLKFRSEASETKPFRQFDISIWKEVKGDF